MLFLCHFCSRLTIGTYGAPRAVFKILSMGLCSVGNLVSCTPARAMPSIMGICIESKKLFTFEILLLRHFSSGLSIGPYGEPRAVFKIFSIGVCSVSNLDSFTPARAMPSFMCICIESKKLSTFEMLFLCHFCSGLTIGPYGAPRAVFKI